MSSILIIFYLGSKIYISLTWEGLGVFKLFICGLNEAARFVERTVYHTSDPLLFFSACLWKHSALSFTSNAFGSTLKFLYIECLGSTLKFKHP